MDESSITGEPDILKKVPIFQTHLSSKNESSFILSGTKGKKFRNTFPSQLSF